MQVCVREILSALVTVRLNADDLGRCLTALERPVSNNADLIEMLRRGQQQILRRRPQ